MQTRIEFKAPWSTLLKVSTAAVSVFLLGVAVAVQVAGRSMDVPGAGAYMAFMAALPLVILLFTALYTIRGYVLVDRTLLVKRLVWCTEVPLAGLASAEVDPAATARSIRTFGIGGAFSFSGYFWNSRLGRYRAFATDLRRAVVLRFSKRTVIVTPDDPQRFATDIQQLMNL